MQRYFVIWLQSTLALLEGRFDDAERLSNEALDIGVAADHPDAFVVWGTQAVILAWQRGDTSHLLDPARELLDQFPDLSAWPAAVALVEAMAGRARRGARPAPRLRRRPRRPRVQLDLDGRDARAHRGGPDHRRAARPRRRSTSGWRRSRARSAS